MCSEIQLDEFTSAGKTHQAGKEKDNVTWVQFVLCVPESNAVAMETLLSCPVNFKLHMHLPVLQVTRLQTTNRSKYRLGEVAC